MNLYEVKMKDLVFWTFAKNSQKAKEHIVNIVTKHPVYRQLLNDTIHQIKTNLVKVKEYVISYSETQKNMDTLYYIEHKKHSFYIVANNKNLEQKIFEEIKQRGIIYNKDDLTIVPINTVNEFFVVPENVNNLIW